MPRYRPEPSTAGPLAQFIEIAFPAHFSSELEKPAQSPAACVLPEGIIDDVGLGSSWGRLHGRRDGFAVQVQGRSHLICLLMHILAQERMHRAPTIDIDRRGASWFVQGRGRWSRPGRHPCYVRQDRGVRRRGTMAPKREHAPLSSDLEDPSAVPYFLWDEPMTVAELQARLRAASPPERTRLLGKILREARDTDVWKFTSPAEVSRLWADLSRHLGRRRPFWE